MKLHWPLGDHKARFQERFKAKQGKEGIVNKQTVLRNSDTKKTKAIKMTDEIKKKVKTWIKADWSPEQVAGRLRDDGIISLHHETIYQYVLADKKTDGYHYPHLRHQNKTYRKRYATARNRTGTPNKVSIQERPEVVNKRARIGDWEADSRIGKNHRGAIVTLDERKSKLRLAWPLQKKKAQVVAASR